MVTQPNTRKALIVLFPQEYACQFQSRKAKDEMQRKRERKLDESESICQEYLRTAPCPGCAILRVSEYPRTDGGVVSLYKTTSKQPTEMYEVAI